MKYEVIARKFRPQRFEDVVGQGPIVQTLKNAIEMDRIGHAYLFSGPRGVGKTTTARLLAKALNCAEGPTSTPCNQCPSCVEIAGGGSTDVLEIDAASNTGVDSIRELRENARYVPLRDRFKVFIIDEIHMLSTSAFNALLKILEEPPEHIAFIMATTERHKLPATILSRCQQFVFRTIPPDEILEHLRTIAARESVKIGEGALEYIVKAAEGSMRDAQSLLDQVIAFGGQEIADQDVRDLLGLVPSETLDASIDAIIARESGTLLQIVESLVEQGLNLQQYVRELSVRMRDLLLVKVDLAGKILCSPEERQRIVEQAGHFSQQDLVRLLDVLLRLENDLRWTSQPRFHLEMGCVKLVTLTRLRDIEEVLRDLQAEPEAERIPPARKSPAGSAGPSSRPAESRETPPRRPRQPPPAPRAPKPEARSAASPKAGSDSAPATSAGKTDSPPADDRTTGADGDTIPERFARRVEAESETTALYLAQASVRVGEEMLEIRVSNPTIRDTLDGEPHRSVLERAAAEVLGRSVPLSFIMTRAAARTAQPDSDVSLREEARNEPLVKSFLEVFRGQIAQVRGAEPPEEGSQR